MTKKGHEAAKELIKELKRCKSQGEDNLIIQCSKAVERRESPSESSAAIDLTLVSMTI